MPKVLYITSPSSDTVVKRFGSFTEEYQWYIHKRTTARALGIYFFAEVYDQYGEVRATYYQTGVLVR